jgi:hypothetical protein
LSYKSQIALQDEMIAFCRLWIQSPSRQPARLISANTRREFTDLRDGRSDPGQPPLGVLIDAEPKLRARR